MSEHFYKRMHIVVAGTQYVRLPDIKLCRGCVAESGADLYNSLHDEHGHACHINQGVWVVDSPEGIAAYVAARMEGATA